MNDRFKFRVWDNGKMLYSEAELFDDMIGFRFGHFNNLDLTLENIIIEQCTGHRDKNGTLIFEGDIRKVSIGDNEFKNLLRVASDADTNYGRIASLGSRAETKLKTPEASRIFAREQLESPGSMIGAVGNRLLSGITSGRNRKAANYLLDPSYEFPLDKYKNLIKIGLPLRRPSIAIPREKD